MITAGLLTGRFGWTEGVQAISFWNLSIKESDLVKCVNKLINVFQEFTEDTVVIADDTSRSFKPRLIGDIPGVQVTKTQKSQPFNSPQKPECAVTIDVKGQPTKLDVILGNFHMVKDDRLPAMKAAVCSQGPKLKSDMEKAGCKLQISMLDQLIKQSDCNNNDYNSLKQSGKISRKQQLRDIFADPEKMNQFRTQKEIDAAWDELQGEHRMTGFKELVKEMHGNV